MLTILQGYSGSGKTTYIINKIRDGVSRGRKTYFLVPEQLSYLSEAMLADLPASSSLCFEVVSFSRLAQIVFSELGGLCDAHISSGERNLVMWQSIRQLAGFLNEYKNVKVDAAFTAMALSAIDELRANQISPDACEELAQKCTSPTLSSKLSDISMIYANFNRNIEELLGEAALENENKLSNLAKLLSSNNFFSGCDFYVDSFTSFTAEEIDILKQIILKADNLTLSLPYLRGDKQPHNKSIGETLRKFTSFAKDRGIELEEIRLEQNLRTNKKELRLIDRSLWNFSLKPDQIEQISPDERGAVELYVARHEYDEIRLSALKILEERENGRKFSDIAVIMRDSESRQGIIDAIFDEMHIPYFYSHKTDLSGTATARLIISALKCISYNFRREDVLNLIKTGLFPISPRQVDMFDDYCNTWQISGSTFLQDVWNMNPDGYQVEMSERGREILISANEVRTAVITPLLTLKKTFFASGNKTQEQCRALYNYLEEINLRQSLSSLAELSLSMGEVREAGEILRIYDFVVSILTEISLVMKDEQTTVEELATAIEIMLKNTDIGSVPSSSDYVTVGSADTLRVEGVRVAILIGLNEGEFPASFSERGLLCEDDKRILEEELETELSSREEYVMSDELFYAYRAMTKPSEKLILIRSSSKLDGKALTASSAWNRVKYILKDRENDIELKETEFDYTKIQLLARLLDKSGNIDENQNESSSSSPDENFQNASDLLPEANEAFIDPLYVRMLFGDKLRLSKSQISAFAECPYKYWCSYILRLREQKESLITYNNSGTIIHFVLEKFLARNKNADGSIRHFTDEEIVKEVNGLVEEYVRETNCPLPPSAGYSFSRLRDLSLIMVKSVVEEFSASRFRIFALEQQIRENREGALKPMEITLSEEFGSPVVSLGGVIDRIDIFDDGEKKFLRIIDYKTGSHKFDTEKISNGQDLQLPAYLFTATLEENKEKFNSEKEIQPVSALFLSADEQSGKIAPTRSGFILGKEDILRAASESLDKNILAGVSIGKDGEIKGKSAVSEEEIQQINDTLRNTIAETAKNMYSGKATRTPSEEACRFCPIIDSCPRAIKKR